MTSQEMFDKVAAHLRKQNAKSSSEEGECFYRGPNGTSCAIGCLLPDEIYRPEMEKKSVVHLVEEFPETKTFIPDLELAEDLQLHHDHNYPSPSWLTDRDWALKQIALKHNLIYGELK